jgi:hypothetical protein
MRGWYVKHELKRRGRKGSWPNLRYYPDFCLEGLRKTTKKLSKDSRSSGRNLNQGPPKYEPGLLSARPRRSVTRKQSPSSKSCVFIINRKQSSRLQFYALESNQLILRVFDDALSVPLVICDGMKRMDDCIWKNVGVMKGINWHCSSITSVTDNNFIKKSGTEYLVLQPVFCRVRPSYKLHSC